MDLRIAVYFAPDRIEKGGGYVQTLRTYEALRNAGFSAQLVLKEGGISAGDIAPDANVHHFIGADPAFIPLMRRIKDRKLGIIALSTIFWWTPEVQRVVTPRRAVYYRYTLARYAKWAIKKILPRYDAYRLADLLLPNSPGEAKLVRRHFPVSDGSIVCAVPNGADPVPDSALRLQPEPPLPSRYILCAGSFNPRKNQLALVRAMKGTSIPVVFMGSPGLYGKSGSYDQYLRRCRAEAGPNVTFLGHTEHRSRIWYSVFANASVFAMPSACETPCLAALEAGLFGSSLALTQIGSAREYFGPYAEYCDPRDIASIRSAVERAWQVGRTQELPKLISSRFTWANVARMTMLAYETAMNRNGMDAFNRAAAGLWFKC
jgi:glycosyltransferase involved in cell wall biosynthesis